MLVTRTIQALAISLLLMTEYITVHQRFLKLVVPFLSIFKW
jgi:hypothetical protein